MKEYENWQIIQTFTYPHEAHLAKAFLESEGVDSEIRDELTVQVNNFYSNAVGGVKLVVREEDYDRGVEVLIKGDYLNNIAKPAPVIEYVLVENDFDATCCPFCKSENISIKKEPNIWTVVVLLVASIAFPIFKRSYKCYDCEKQWKYKRKP